MIGGPKPYSAQCALGEDAAVIKSPDQHHQICQRMIIKNEIINMISDDWSPSESTSVPPMKEVSVNPCAPAKRIKSYMNFKIIMRLESIVTKNKVMLGLLWHWYQCWFCEEAEDNFYVEDEDEGGGKEQGEEVEDGFEEWYVGLHNDVNLVLLGNLNFWLIPLTSQLCWSPCTLLWIN